MRTALYGFFTSTQKWGGSKDDSLALLVKVAFFSALIGAGGYLAVLYLVSGR